MPALTVRQLGKSYRLFASPRDRMKALLTGRAHHSLHWALSDVSFELGKGQCLGVIGANGAGKSTLLKLITGTLRPSTGEIFRSGRLSAILELGAGFHPEFTGRDNLYFGGALIGIPAREMAALESAIVEFSELGSAIHRPVKTYSSGMAVRLAFSLVTAVEPEVLIIDEALAVGDQRFQKKCIERIEEFRKSGCTILFCSHSQYHVRQLCDRAIWLDEGRMRAFGATEGVLSAYESHVKSIESAASELAPIEAPRPRRGTDPGRRAGLTSIALADLAPGEPPLLQAKDLRVTVRAFVNADERPNFGVMLEQANGVGITSVATHVDGFEARMVAPGEWEATVTFQDLPLYSGDYVISAYLFDSQGIVVYDEWLNYQTFRWVFEARTPGLVRLPHQWS